MDKIFIKGLKIEAIIGIYAHERVAKQPLIFDIELITDITKPAATDLISDAIDYDLIAQKIEALVNESQFLLLESLISYIAEKLLELFSMQEIICTVYKPQALTNATTVGITIARSAK